MRSPFPTERRRAGATRRAIRGTLTLAAALLVACGDATPSSEPVRVVIASGTSFRAAADSLERSGVIGSSRLFRLYAKLSGRDRALKAGTYELSPDAGWGELLDDLTQGRGLVASITIPEGFAVSSIVPVLARRLEVPEDSVQAAVRDSALRQRLAVPTETLEGYLFPETYTFPVGTPARVAVTEMVSQFEQRWKPEWNARLTELGMTRHELVTLASIVEKEARVAEERPVIAAVYRNRLRIGMPLQADPTVQYAIGAHVERVLYKHLEIDSPYNTYRNPGLPPGPIASPGSASLEASLFPADVPYLYFVARPDGRHEFRTTFAEHTRAIAEIRREQQRRQAAESTAGRDSVAAPRDSTRR